VKGQGVIGRDCAWCGLPAVCEIEVQPIEQRTITRVDPVSGARTSHQSTVRAAIVVSACDQHRQITIGQPPPVGSPRHRKARGIDQLGLFVSSDEARLCNAIIGDPGR
jgi:hypothetical protein